MRLPLFSARSLLLTLSLAIISSTAYGQTEVLTVQGNLPRYNYRDSQGALLWSTPANSVLWKIDGPFNAGVVVLTAAAKSGSISVNEGGVSIRGGGFPSAKLHVGTILSQDQPGEVRVDPGNPAALGTIYAVNASLPTTMVLETQGANLASSIKFASKTANFSNTVGTNYRIRDNLSAVNPFVIIPGPSNDNAIVIRNGNVGFGVANPTTPIALANGAKCTAGGVWTNASSRALKQDIQDLSLANARETLRQLKPVTYSYLADPDEEQVGFIAEEVPNLVATNTRTELSPMDFVAVLTKVVQDQETKLEEQQKRIDAQDALIQKLVERIEKVENRSR